MNMRQKIKHESISIKLAAKIEMSQICESNTSQLCDCHWDHPIL